MMCINKFLSRYLWLSAARCFIADTVSWMCVGSVCEWIRVRGEICCVWLDELWVAMDFSMERMCLWLMLFNGMRLDVLLIGLPKVACAKSTFYLDEWRLLRLFYSIFWNDCGNDALGKCSCVCLCCRIVSWLRESNWILARYDLCGHCIWLIRTRCTQKFIEWMCCWEGRAGTATAMSERRACCWWTLVRG